MSKDILLLGSTGSIGVQSLEIIQHLGCRVVGLSVHRNLELLGRQVQQFRPAYVAVCDQQAAELFSREVASMENPPRVFGGPDAAEEMVKAAECDIVLNAIVGIAGLQATLAALACGRVVALANKESLVAGGQLVMDAVREHGGNLLPVDSEHSAIFQCLQDAPSAKSLERIYLTASGGPFYGFTRKQLKLVTLRDTLHHPNWDMGAKITVDSATMMNKGLELIEAMWLFGLPAEKIQIVVQNESIIHSMVEFSDHSVLAQLGVPDMRLPIQYALTWPERLPGPAPRLDFTRIVSLSFGRPDPDTFRCLAACMRAADMGGLAPCAVNCANEEAVKLFLDERITFLDIGELVEGCLAADRYAGSYTLEDVHACDEQARRYVREHAVER